MKLYEFVDRLYAMGDMEAPKTLNESARKPKRRKLNESADTIRNLSKAQKDFFDMAAKCTDGTIENPTVKFYKTCINELAMADNTGVFRNDIYYRLDEYSTKTKIFDSENLDYLEYELSLMLQKFPDETFVRARKSLQKDIEGKAVKKEFSALAQLDIDDVFNELFEFVEPDLILDVLNGYFNEDDDIWYDDVPEALMAIDDELGIPDEKILSDVLNQLPDDVRDEFVEYMADEYGLEESVKVSPDSLEEAQDWREFSGSDKAFLRKNGYKRVAKDLNESYTVSDELFDEYKSDDFKDVGDIHNEIMFNYGDKDLADDVVSRIEVYRNNRDDDDDYDEEDDLYEEGLTEAANPENAEVNAVLRKWANSDRNRISKRDQKVLDDAGIKLKTNKYDAPHKYAVHKDNEGDILDLHRMDKRHIKNTHPDHDLANDLATTGRHWSNRDRYNKNKDPNFPWRNDAYREETPEESKALRPYSDEYKKQKRIADYERYLRGEGLTEDKDLSTVKGSMTKILQDNREKIDACGSAKEVHDTVAGLLAEAGLDTPATRRLLLTLKKQKGLTGALQAVYNSILKGSDLGTLK